MAITGTNGLTVPLNHSLYFWFRSDISLNASKSWFICTLNTDYVIIFTGLIISTCCTHPPCFIVLCTKIIQTQVPFTRSGCVVEGGGGISHPLVVLEANNVGLY